MTAQIDTTVVDTVRQLASEFTNVRNGAVPVTHEDEHGAGVRIRKEYLAKVADAERRLREQLPEAKVVELLHSVRYWEIQKLPKDAPRLAETVGLELDATIRRLHQYSGL